jgi:hypothetical protein
MTKVDRLEATPTERSFVASACFSAVARPTGVRVPFLACALVVLASGLGLGGCGGNSAARGPAGAPSTIGSTRVGPNDAEHEAAIAHLAEAPWGMRIDKRRTFSLPLPDGGNWTHVKFWGVTTLAGFRYGDSHHAVAAAFVFASTKSEATVEGCSRRFLEWGRAHAKAFDLDIGEPRVDVVPWLGAPPPEKLAAPATTESMVRIYVLDAERRSVFGTSRYPSAFAVYPAWKDACLVVGVSVPGDDAPLADAVRDRLVRDALPAVVTKAGQGKLALEAAIDIDE